MKTCKLYIVGAGMGGTHYLTEYARSVTARAGLVLATGRLHDSLRTLNDNMVCKDFTELAACIDENKTAFDSICVLVSGDTGFYSAAKTLSRGISGVDTEWVSGVSSLQYLTAKLGVCYDDVVTVSVHGREGFVVPRACYNRAVFVLTGGSRKAHDVIAELISAGLTDVIVTVGENLSAPNERIVTDTALNMAGLRFENLSVMLVENKRFADTFRIIGDEEFIRGKIPMTKSAVRAITLNALGIHPGDVIADIGAGTGAVSVEMARRAREGMVYAIEKVPEAVGLIKQNAAKFGAYNINVLEGGAPAALDALPPVDKAFIGGSGGCLNDIITTLARRNANIRIVVNAVTLETLNAAIGAFDGLGFATRVTCANIANARDVGGLRLMTAENPVYIISGGKPDGS